MVNPEKIKMSSDERINFRSSLGDLIDLIANMKQRVADGKCPNALPLTVVKLEGDENYDYLVVDGKRRVQACLQIRVPEMLAVITEETDKTKLRNISFLANQYHKDMDWIEQASCFRAYVEEGFSLGDISKMLGVNKSYVSRCLNGLEILEEVQSVGLSNGVSIPPIVPDLRNVLLLKKLKEIEDRVEDYDRLTDLVPFYLYCVEGELNRSDASKAMAYLADFYHTIYIIRCNGDETLANILYDKYFHYRYVPQILDTVFKKEIQLRRGEGHRYQYLDLKEYPTKEDAEKYAKEHTGGFIGKVTIEGWKLFCSPFSLAEIDEQFRKLREKYAKCDR